MQETNNASHYGSFDADKNANVTEDSASDSSRPTSEYQDGIQKAESTALVWSKPALIGTYIGIYVMFFILSLQSQSFYSLTPYVYSSFSLHELISVSSVMASIIGGVLRLPVSKMIDIWGRAEGFLVMTAVIVLGLILMASCTGVAQYAAAYVIYLTGYDCIYYILQVFIADTSQLRNRGLMLAFAQTPFIATTFAGPALANAFLKHSTWHWGFGTFCIVYPAVALPLAAVFLYHQKKAYKLGIIKKHSSGRSFAQSLKHYFIEFDAVGMILVMAGLVLFLLPFSLTSTLLHGWNSAEIIAMIVIGGILLFVVFPLYEIYLAPKSFLPFRLLLNRTIAGSCITIGGLYVTFYCWDLYFLSFLQVVFGLTVANAGYVANIYNIGSCFWGVIVGLLIRQTNRFKWLGLSAIPLYMLGSGLMIYFRSPSSRIGYVIMCQIFIAFAGGQLVITQEIAALAAGTHGEVAVILAIISLASQIGGAIGASIAGAIWQNTFLPALTEALPADSKSQAATIYASLTTQLSYTKGTPIGDAIITAYGVSQRDMCIAATATTILILVGVLMWRNIRVNEKRQVKGTVV